jgi:AcrR family transcriptional regulator
MAESTALKGMSLDDKLTYILDLSYEALAEVGYNKITMEMVAEKVGVSKGTISYYFKNKEELIAKTLTYLADTLFSDVMAGTAESSYPKQKLINYVESSWRHYWNNKRHPEVYKVYYDLWFHGFYNKRLQGVANEIKKNFQSGIRNFIAEIYDNDILKKERLDIKAIMVAAAIDGAARLVLSGLTNFAPEDLLQELKETVLKIVD